MVASWLRVNQTQPGAFGFFWGLSPGAKNKYPLYACLQTALSYGTGGPLLNFVSGRYGILRCSRAEIEPEDVVSPWKSNYSAPMDARESERWITQNDMCDKDWITRDSRSVACAVLIRVRRAYTLTATWPTTAQNQGKPPSLPCFSPLRALHWGHSEGFLYALGTHNWFASLVFPGFTLEARNIGGKQ